MMILDSICYGLGAGLGITIGLTIILVALVKLKIIS
jgi:hypothetical protein